jgi:hypothetical protein
MKRATFVIEFKGMPRRVWRHFQELSSLCICTISDAVYSTDSEIVGYSLMTIKKELREESSLCLFLGTVPAEMHENPE